LADLLTRYEETHERIGAALHNIAVANLRANKLSDAKDAIEEAFRIRKTALGEQHPKVGDSLVEYGIILMALKENERALKVFHEALCAREEEVLQSKGTESSQGSQLRLAKVWHNIGCVNFKLGRLEEAQDSYAKAIEQQKNAFGNWNEALSKKGDATKPGFLTMASTICNQAYIELEQGNYANALSFFFDSLEIQRVLLEADNKLIATTMQNIGYAYCLKSDFGKAREIYKDLATLQQESYVSHAKKGWLRSIKNLIYCQLRLFDFQSAFETLRNLEDVLSAEERGVAPSRDLQTTHELMGEVNFQLLKIQSLSDYTQQLLDRSCGVCKWPTPERLEAIDAEAWFPTKPSHGSKMSGHRMSYA
jgi:tetratricopeptide (TPR) repeat protein